MMIRDDLKGAGEPVLKLIVEQAEKRLAAQCGFADAQDTRGTSLVNAAAALAAASVALGGGSYIAQKAVEALTVGSLVGLVGFTISACLGLWALRSGGFHACGFYPDDFVQDLQANRSTRDLYEDFALDLQIRLTDNKHALNRRGQRTDLAASVLIATPLVALVGAFLVA